MTRRSFILPALLVVALMGGGVAWAQAPLTLRAGAARVDVTPLESELPKTSEGVNDRLNARAIVVDNGVTSAALITVDTGGFSDEIWKSLTQRIETTLRIPAANVLLTATHTHAAPRVTSKTYEDNIFKAVQLAKERLQPARIGYGTGVSYMNVNRNIIDPRRRIAGGRVPTTRARPTRRLRWSSSRRPNGDPIAVYYNYAMHAVINGQLDKVSADFVGRRLPVHRRLVRRQDRGGLVDGRRGRPEPDLLPADVRPARDPDQGLREARRGHQQRHAARRPGLEQEGPDGDQADEPAEANGALHGPVPRRRGHARDAGHRANLHERENLRGSEDDHVSRPRANEYRARGVPGRVQRGRAGRYPAGAAADRRHRARRRERRGVQPDRASD